MNETKILDGRKVSVDVLEVVSQEVEQFKKLTGRAPGLAVIHAGEDPASTVYVRNKEKACAKTGVTFTKIVLPEKLSHSELINAIDTLNEDETCDGLIVQLPLPVKSIDENEIIQRIAVDKDVDGFHPETMGRLWAGTGEIAPCTPAGVMELIDAYNLELEGKNAVIVGRSNIVGKPMAALLLRRNATVTVAHSRTQNLPELCRSADILVAAIGKPGFIGKEHIKPGAVVIDVGINRITCDEAPAAWRDENTPIGRKLAKRGASLVGDVDPIEVQGIASWYTPVPGGVGRMTVAMLLKNTVTLALRRAGICRKDGQ